MPRQVSPWGTLLQGQDLGSCPRKWDGQQSQAEGREEVAGAGCLGGITGCTWLPIVTVSLLSDTSILEQTQGHWCWLAITVYYRAQAARAGRRFSPVP